MKKYSFIALVALAAWGLTSCDEYTLPNPPAQSNEQEQEFVPGDVAVTSYWADEDITLMNFAQDVPMCQVATSYLPEGYGIRVVAQMAQNSDFANFGEVECFINADSTFYMANREEMEAAFIKINGKNPATKSIVLRYLVYAVNGSTTYRVGSPDTYYAVTPTQMTPVGPGHAVYEEYYFVSSANGWDVATSPLMTQSTQGDPYDNPEFFVEFATSAKDVEYKLIPNTTFVDDDHAGYRPVEPTAMEGELEFSSSLLNAGKIQFPGQYKLTANMLDLTYRINYNFPVLYVASAANKTEATMLQLPTDNRTYYRGVAVLANNFWLTGTPDNPEIGFSNAESTEGDEDFSGKLLYNDKASQTAMIVDAKKAFYMVIANITDGKWSATQIKTLGAVGDFQGWDPSSAPTFSHSADFLTWTIKGLELNGNDFKICGNGGWGINFGGSPDNLVVDGGNFTNYGGAGKYDITLDFSKLPYTATLTKL